MADQQFIPEGMQKEVDRRIQAARGNLATVRQELEQQLKGLGAQQAAQTAQSSEAGGTLGEIALLRGELLYIDSLAEREKTSQSGSKRHSGTPVQTEPGFSDKWQALQPTKAHVIWAFLVGVLLTLLLGFTWGGWVTPGTAQKASDSASKSDVIERLAPMCVAQFNLDPDKDAKLAELTALSSYQRAEYVKTQGWSTMPGEAAPDRLVTDACVKLLMQIGQ
jgi:hypothetical protein